MQRNALSIASVIAGLAAATVTAGSEILPRGFGYQPPTPAPRRSGYRQGRRFWASQVNRPGGNPAGTKLAKQAAKGMLTIVRIR